MKNSTNNVNLARGFSMIEILITLVIIALALLGSAGLQAYALKTNQGGQFRNQAAFFVSDIVERMAANKIYSVSALTAYDTALSSTTDCTQVNCTPAQLAAYDVTAWQAAIASAVPGGIGAVTQTASGNPSTYTIKVSWLDRQTNTNYAAGASAVSGVSETFSITSNVTLGQ